MFQTTKDDIIFSGHGAALPNNGRVTRVPYGVEFYMFGPLAPASQTILANY